MTDRSNETLVMKLIPYCFSHFFLLFCHLHYPSRCYLLPVDGWLLSWFRAYEGNCRETTGTKEWMRLINIKPCNQIFLNRCCFDRTTYSTCLMCCFIATIFVSKWMCVVFFRFGLEKNDCACHTANATQKKTLLPPRGRNKEMHPLGRLMWEVSLAEL